MIEILESIQVRAAQTITGAFGATSIPALNVETFLPPAKIQLERLTAESYIRIMTSPLFSTLQQIRKTNRHRRAAKDWDPCPKRWSPLERHERRCKNELGRQTMEKLEQKIPWLTPPWWHPPAIQILDSAEKAKGQHDRILQKEK